MKVLLNKCYGGYSFSEEFVKHLIYNDIVPDYTNYHNLQRHDQRVVEEAIKFGLDNASGMCASLEVREVPDGANYSISEYDGMESIDHIWIDVHVHELKYGLKQHQLQMVMKGCNIKPIKLEEL
jgi:hypothetical protein